MDKATLMRAFKAICAETAGTGMSEKCKLLAAPLMGLKPIELREAHIRSQQLSQEICYDGRVAHANICATAKVGKRLVLCLVEAEDEDGAAAYLHVFNALKSTSKQEDAELMFPKDAKLAIKEPLCFGSLLHVSSPASVEFVGLAKKSKRRPVDELRKEGNRLLLNHHFVLSELYFTECINLFLARDKFTYGEMEKEVFANRAEARMKLGRYEEAIEDAEFAMKIGTSKVHQVKSLYSKGKSLSALQDHKQALACFESAAALEEPMPTPDVLDGLKRSEILLRQSQTGDYDISDYLLKGLDDKLAPEFSDYIGPLEVKMTPDGRGRGVFLTKDVEIGDLLAVCNPTGVASGYEDAEEDMFVELVRACTNSEKSLKQVYSLAEEMKTVPDLRLFKSNAGKVFPKPSNRVVNLDKIMKVRNRVGFTCNRDGVYVPGLWGFVGLFNHSCLPNTSKVCIGNAAFLRAAKDMKAGDELLLSYVDPLSPLVGHRDRLVERFGFHCTCKRCTMEKDNKELLKDLPYDEEIDDNVVGEVLEIEKTIGSLTEEEKNWIRASFPDYYCAACLSDEEGLPSFEEVLEIFNDVAPGNTAALTKMAIVSNYCGSTPETLEIITKQVTSLYGKQSQEAVDAVIEKFKTPTLL